jgi:limonene-1,2-epoxide hydrolase
MCILQKKYFSPLRILKYNKSNIDNMHKGSPHPMVNTDVKKSTTRGVGTIRQTMLSQKMESIINFEIRCPRLAKNAFAIQHLLHHSIV